MDKLTLKASKRDVLGKKVRLLRQKGVVPAHVYGHDIESLALQCETSQLQQIIAKAGTTRLLNLKVDDEKSPRSVFVREMQRDVITRQLLHIDFYQVKETEKIETDVPIVLVGEAPAMKGKGRMITRGISSLRIECLPSKLPPQIEVDLGPLTDLDKMILVKDIAVGPDVMVKTDPEQLVVRVSEVVIEVEEVAPKPAVEAEAEAAAARRLRQRRHQLRLSRLKPRPNRRASRLPLSQ
ncbi:MAG: 50S ribosomal protein L25 [Chloroflexota bacterium]